MKHILKSTFKVFFSSVLLVSLCLSFPLTTSAQLNTGPSPEIQMEIEYARRLQNFGLPQFASVVLERIRDKAPEAATIIEVMELQGRIAQGQFDEVKQIIARKPNQDGQEVWAMKLALADGYYAWGRYAEAQGIYESFFQRYPDGPPEAINSFYVESAYKYSQMLLLMGNEKAAIKAYDYLTKAEIERHIRRQILSEKAELLLKVAEKSPPAERAPYFQQVEEINNEIVWRQDVWFGKAIVNMAHMAMMKGETEQAMRLIDDYRDNLLAIDEALRAQEEESGEPLSRLSPMAQCRYLLGVMLQKEAEKMLAEGGDRSRIIFMLAGGDSGGQRRQGALHHFANVFLRYPGTPWAADAGLRLETVQNILKDQFGADINIDVPADQMAKVEKFQFQEARTMFNQNQFEEAIEAYYRVLNLFSESETAAAAVSELARCYIELGREEDTPFRDMVVHYLAERFSGNPETMNRAGNELLRIAGIYSERNLHGAKDDAYELFFNYFKDHPRAAPTIYYFGEVKLGEKNYEEALPFYKVVASNYPGQSISIDALNRISYCYAELGNTTNEIATLSQMIERLGERERPGQDYISSFYRKIAALRSIADEQRRARRDADAEANVENESSETEEITPEAAEKKQQYDKAVAELSEITEKTRRAMELFKQAREKNNAERQKQLRPILLKLRDLHSAKKEELETLQAELQATAPATESTDPYEELVGMYDELIALLTASDSEQKFATEPGDVEKNQEILEGALFFRSATLAMLNKPEDEQRRMRIEAIRTFMQLVKEFPDSRFAPAALSQIGTLWTVLDKPDEAEKALRQLQQKYPDSNEARNSLFVLGRNLLELGRREQAVNVFKEMFESGGEYNSSQILTAGRELLAENEYEISLDAFKRVLAAENERAYVEPSLLGKGQCLIELGQPAEGVKVLAELIEKYPNSVSLINAAKYLSRGYAELGESEKDDKERFRIFNEAVKSMRTARRHEKSTGGQAELDVEVGRLIVSKANAEKQFGDAAKAESILGDAVAAYQSLIMLSDMRDPDVRPHIEEAYHRCLPLLLQIKRYDAALEDAETFLREFPRSPYASDVRRWRSQARVQLAASGQEIESKQEDQSQAQIEETVETAETIKNGNMPEETEQTGD